VIDHRFSRRYFFYGTLLSGAVPTGGFGSPQSLSAMGYKSPNEKLNIGAVGIGSGAQQVGHPMQYDLEAGRSQQCRGAVGLGNRMAALVKLQDGIIQALHTHLDFGHAQRTEPGQFSRADFIGAGFH